MSAANHGYTVEWHPTPRIWVAYRGCGCAECPKGFGKTEAGAIANLEEQLEEQSSATHYSGGNDGR